MIPRVGGDAATRVGRPRVSVPSATLADMDRRRLATIFAIVLVDVIGFGLILPLLPYYVKTLAPGTRDYALLVGLLTASYAAAQLIGGPLLGRMSDRFGRRPILLISIAGTAVGFLLLGFAHSIAMLFAGRIIDGLTGGNFTVAQAYISDVTDARHRAQGLGLTGAAFGVGFMIGPAMGGLLSRFGYPVPAFTAAALATINLCAVAALLPESLSEEQKVRLAASPRRGFSISGLVEALRRPRVAPLLDMRLFFGLAFSMFQAGFTVWGVRRLGLSAQSTGLTLFYVGLLSVFTQLVLIKPLTARFNDAQLIVGATALTALGFVGWATVGQLWVFLVLLAPLNIGISVLNTILGSSLSKAVYPEEVGGVFGLSTGIQSVTQIVAPVLGGLLLDRLGTWGPGAFCALMVAPLVPFAYRRFISRPDPPLPERVLAED
jgi:MFS transporter, DHA1 family, tetracycline resistance protein